MILQRTFSTFDLILTSMLRTLVMYQTSVGCPQMRRRVSDNYLSTPNQKRRSVPQNMIRRNDILMFTGKRFDENFESRITKKGIQNKMVNIDIIPILFVIETYLNKLGRPANGKTKSTLKRKLKELEQ